MSDYNYIASKNIEVFPSAYRGADDNTGLKARLTLEENYARFTNWTLNNSYVISWDDTNKKIKFNLQGYFFDITLSDAELSGDNLYVAIKLKSVDATIVDSKSINITTLQPMNESGYVLDTDNNFVGLAYYTTEPEDVANTYVLHLLEKKDNKYVIPEKSKTLTYLGRIAVLDENNEFVKNLSDYISYSKSKDELKIASDSSITIGDSTQNNSNSVTLNGGNSSIKVGTTIDIQAGDTLSASAGVVSLNGYTTNITGSTINISGNTTASGNSINLKTNTNVSEDLSVTGKITCTGITSNSHDLEKGKYTISVDDSGNLTITENW